MPVTSSQEQGCCSGVVWLFELGMPPLDAMVILCLCGSVEDASEDCTSSVRIAGDGDVVKCE